MAATQRGAFGNSSRFVIGVSVSIGFMSTGDGRLEILQAGDTMGQPCPSPAIWAVSGRALRQPGVTLAAPPHCLGN